MKGQLASSLHQNINKKNKQQLVTLKTLLEVFTYNLIHEETAQPPLSYFGVPY